MKMGLGTVQLGLEYGIANKSGRPTGEQAMAILQAACDHGVTVWDTAAAYGSSEELIGGFCAAGRGADDVMISTKIRPLHQTEPSLIPQTVSREITASLHRLGRRLDFLLFHSAADLLAGGQVTLEAIAPFQEQRLVGRVGVSVYSPEEIRACLAFPQLGVIQAPYNVWDRRVLEPSLLAEMKSRDILLHSRSVYLQGLLLLESEALPPYLSQAKPHLEAFRSLCGELGLTPQQAAFLYVRDQPEIDTFFIGCETTEQVKENLHLYSQPPLSPAGRERLEEAFGAMPEELINPSKWRK
ncbi:aldo/keto reductase [Oscillospiraceae bacterium MB08-C2-2]|nr:aldo/keto reductase [Oscillospiraceae bacterium MB08-C2-2]